MNNNVTRKNPPIPQEPLFKKTREPGRRLSDSAVTSDYEKKENKIRDNIIEIFSAMVWNG